MCRWIMDNLGPDVPIHFTRFHPLYRMQNLPPTPVATLETAYDIARDSGLKFVYIGNVPGHAAESTYCPNCHRKVIERIGYQLREISIQNGRCTYCQQNSGSMELNMYPKIVLAALLAIITAVSIYADERPAYNAGTFYPAKAPEITSQITEFLKNAGTASLSSKPLGIIVPHAGYVYSGAVAAHAYREIKNQNYDAVIILAPCHVEYFPFAAIYPGEAYLTPLGKVLIDKHGLVVALLA
jgi:hypothetical protein